MNTTTEQSLAGAYNTATKACNHIMEPIHQINEYIDSKNAYDEQLAAGTIQQADYDTNVKGLQSNYFGDNKSQLALAEKFEAVKDWGAEHGITDAKSAVAVAAGGIKNAFAQTSFGKTYAEIKQMAADGVQVADSGVTSDANQATTDQASSETSADITARRSQQAEEAISGISSSSDMEDSAEMGR